VVDVVFRALLRGVAGAQRHTFQALPWYSLAYADAATNTDERGQGEPAVVITVALDDHHTRWVLAEVAAGLAELFDQRSVAFIGDGCKFIDRWGRDEGERNRIQARHAGAVAGALAEDWPAFDGWPYGCRPAFKGAAEQASAMVAEGTSPEDAIKATTDAAAVRQVLFVTGGGQ
jgi:hypothetical protein